MINETIPQLVVSTGSPYSSPERVHSPVSNTSRHSSEVSTPSATLKDRCDFTQEVLKRVLPSMAKDIEGLERTDFTSRSKHLAEFLSSSLSRTASSWSILATTGIGSLAKQLAFDAPALKDNCVQEAKDLFNLCMNHTEDYEGQRNCTITRTGSINSCYNFDPYTIGLTAITAYAGIQMIHLIGTAGMASPTDTQKNLALKNNVQDLIHGALDKIYSIDNTSGNRKCSEPLKREAKNTAKLERINNFINTEMNNARKKIDDIRKIEEEIISNTQQKSSIIKSLTNQSKSRNNENNAVVTSNKQVEELSQKITTLEFEKEKKLAELDTTQNSINQVTQNLNLIIKEINSTKTILDN